MAHLVPESTFQGLNHNNNSYTTWQDHTLQKSVVHTGVHPLIQNIEGKSYMQNCQNL